MTQQSGSGRNARPFFVLLAVLALLVTSGSWNPGTAQAPPPFDFVIDTGIEVLPAVLPAVQGQLPAVVVAVVGPDNLQENYVSDEVILKPADAAELQDFLNAYGGVVVGDGQIPDPPPEIPQSRLRLQLSATPGTGPSRSISTRSASIPTCSSL